MKKTQKELDQIKLECEELSNKLKELSEEELQVVTAGTQECDSFVSKTLERGKNGNPVI